MDKEFVKTDGGKIGVYVDAVLTRPHRDNDYRLEESLKSATNEYMRRNETSVLGRIVQGKFKKNDYVTDQVRINTTL